MTLGDLLELLRESMLNDRTDRVSGSSDYLWTDKTLVRFMNEAQRRFATQGLILRDATSNEATKITLVAGQSSYPLHEAVFAVLSAKGETQQADLTRVGHAALAAYRAPSDTWIDPASLVNANPGPALAFSTDEGLSSVDTDSLTQINLRVYPTPSVDQAGHVLRLRVCRKPLCQLDVHNPGESPEIPEDHHLEMLDWAAYLALRIVDDDAGAARRAEGFKASFEDHVKEARTHVMRKLFAPIGYGFGRGGFSWSN